MVRLAHVNSCLVGWSAYGYEPWHYRYFGKALAAAIHASGETLRAWLWQQRTIEAAPPPSPRDTGAITVITIQGLLGAP